MDAEARLAELRSLLVGQLITDRQLAGNSLSIWVATRPAEQVGYTIWLEPSWHVAGPAGVLAGSRQAQDEEEASGWTAVTETIDTLVGRTIELLEVNATTGDLAVTLSGGVVARTFVTDPRETDLWRIRELATNRRLIGSPRGLHLGADA